MCAVTLILLWHKPGQISFDIDWWWPCLCGDFVGPLKKDDSIFEPTVTSWHLFVWIIKVSCSNGFLFIRHLFHLGLPALGFSLRLWSWNQNSTRQPLSCLSYHQLRLHVLSIQDSRSKLKLILHEDQEKSSSYTKKNWNPNHSLAPQLWSLSPESWLQKKLQIEKPFYHFWISKLFQ